MIDYIKLEKELDEINGEFGDYDRFCLFCKSKKYNGKVGIIHIENCIILQLREIIKNDKKR